MDQVKKLLSSGVLVIGGTLIGSAFSYLFNMLMGRMLGPVEYGELTSIMSLITIAAVAGGAVLTVSMRYTGELFGANNLLGIKRLLKVFTRYVLFFGIFLGLISTSLIGEVKDFLSIEKTTPLLIAFSSLVFAFPVMVNCGVLQGIQKFIPLTIANTTGMLAKLALGVLLVRLGFGLNGALLAVVSATLVSYAITFWPLASIIKIKEKSDTAKLHFDRKEVAIYTMPTLVAALFLSVGINMDILLVKHLFAPEEAGLYAAISTIAKIIFYVLGPLISVMFPLISEKLAKGEKHYQTFLFALAITVGAGLFAVGIYTTIPGLIIKLLYGEAYVSFFGLLPQVAIFVLFFTLINLVANYFMAIKDFKFLWFFVIVVAATVVTTKIWHPDIQTVIRISISYFGLLFFLMMGYYLFTKKEQIKSLLDGTYNEKFAETVHSHPGL